jgi:hypothetical protein
VEWLLDAAMPFGLDIYDRGHGRSGTEAEQFTFPERFASAIRGGLPYRDVVKAYKRYKVFLNVNSVADSPTMFSRRVFELLACGTVVLSTPAAGIGDVLGSDVVQIASSREQASAMLARLLGDDGLRDRLGLAGQRLVAESHTYAHRLAEIGRRLDLRVSPDSSPRVSLLAWAPEAAVLDEVVGALARQRGSGDIVLVCASGDRDRAEQSLKQAGLEGRTALMADGDPADASRWWRQAVAEAAGDFIALFCPEDHYGPWYLADLVRALGYSGADVVGKAAHFAGSGADAGPAIMNADLEYSFVEGVLPAAMVARRELIADLGRPGFPLHDASALAPWAASGVRLFAADRFSYVRAYDTRLSSAPLEGVDI